jgi:acyl-coenzyme A thioesterase PaaI-like protein
MTSPAPVPVPFRTMFAGLRELRGRDSGSRFHECFGCGPHHEIGLRVRCFSADGEVLAPIVIPMRFEGPPGTAHGGIVAAYLDEILAGAALNHGGRTYLTGELTVRYVKPTPIDRPLLGRGRATKDSGRYLDVEGTLEDLETREVVARATGRFFPLSAPDATPSA